jgi:capsular exopolysaccharide synthesis family protein
LLQRLKEAGVSAGLRASNIAVLDPAEVPETTYRPMTMLNYAVGLGAGLLLGVALAFAGDHLQTRIRTPEEVERLTALGLLAVIPRSRGKHERKAPRRLIEGGGAMESWQPEQDLAEAYRTLRSSVLLGADESMRRILVTSAQPQEGKTTLSLNLACSLAQLGRRVLLIDADMRRPDCAYQLDVRGEGGLSEYLRGEIELKQALQATSIAGLSLISAGRSTATASDLLHSPRLAELLAAVGAQFEHVVLDSPPSLVLSDARTLSRLVEGVVLVVSDQTERGSLLRTKRIFDDAGVSFLGFVMNRVNLNQLDYGYYRDYGYHYDYSAANRRKGRRGHGRAA